MLEENKEEYCQTIDAIVTAEKITFAKITAEIAGNNGQTQERKEKRLVWKYKLK